MVPPPDAGGGKDLEDDGPSQVDAWESDLEDDECELEPEVDADEADGSLDAQRGRAQWTDVDTMRADHYQTWGRSLKD